ncbi:ribonuclease H-like domain-containing protein [Tanacetum coccineum]
MIYKTKHRLSHLRSFGYLCYSIVLNEFDKFSSKSHKCVLIGFSSVKKAYKLYSLDSKVVFYSRDLRFYENVFPFRMNKDLLNEASKSFMENSQVDHLNLFDEKYNQNFKRANDEGRVSPYNDGSVHSSHESKDDFATSMGDKNTFSKGNVSKSPTNPRSDYISFDPNSPKVSNENRIVEKQPQLDTRLYNKPTKMPAKFNNYVINSSHMYALKKHVNYSNLSSCNHCFVTSLNKSTEPPTFYDATKDNNWIKAMNNELEALDRNNTWTITNLLTGRKAIGSTWIFKIKYKAFGEVEGYKARLVAKGFSHKEGLDCKDTFSPVVKMTNVKFEDVYMYLPLVENGFKQSKYDYSLYTKSSDNVFIALLVYVDDIVITENNVNEIEKFESFLSSKSKFHIKDLGFLNQYMHCPLKSHMSLALRVLRYLKGSPGIGLQFNKLGGFNLKVYSDSDRAKCLVTRKSVSRNIDAWHLQIMNSAIKIAANPVFHEKTKHFELDIHLVKEKVASGVMKLSLGEAYERNIIEIQDKRGIVSANASDVSNQSSSSSYVSIRKNDKGDMEIVTPCMEATIQVTDLDENFLLLRLKDVTKKGNNIERSTRDLDEKYLKMLGKDAKENEIQLLSDYYCWKDYADKDEINDLSKKR